MFACITQLHSSKPAEDEPVYPHLKALLHYDTREFLNVLALVGTLAQLYYVYFIICNYAGMVVILFQITLVWLFILVIHLSLCLVSHVIFFICVNVPLLVYNFISGF